LNKRFARFSSFAIPAKNINDKLHLDYFFMFKKPVCNTLAVPMPGIANAAGVNEYNQ